MTSIPIYAYVLVMALVTYAVRMAPMVLFRKRIRSVFIRSFLKYIPYAVLGSMTIPAIFYSTSNFLSAACGFAAAVILAIKKKSLLVVSICACIVAYLVSLLPFR